MKAKDLNGCLGKGNTKVELWSLTKYKLIMQLRFETATAMLQRSTSENYDQGQKIHKECGIDHM